MTSPELQGPLHLLKCSKELLGMKALELLQNFSDMIDDALDVDFGGEDE